MFLFLLICLNTNNRKGKRRRTEQSIFCPWLLKVRAEKQVVAVFVLSPTDFKY